MRTKISAVAFLIGILTIGLFVMATPAKAESSDAPKANTLITGTLTALSGTAAPATLTVTAGATTYTVEVSVTTVIVRRFQAVSNLTEMLINDTLEVRGTMSNDTTNTITATKIRDISVQRMGGTFNGNIVKTSCTSSTFTFKPKDRAEQTVYLGTATKIIRGGEKVTCADLANGEMATVIGLWRPATKRIDADRVIVHMRTLSGTITAITLTNGGLPATLTVKHSKSEQVWTVNVTSATKLFRRHMGTATIDEFAVGDTIEARGTKGTGNTINAKMVRDNSIVIKNRDFQSRVKSIDAEAKTFVITISRKEGIVDITVTTTNATKYFKDEETASFSDITVGDKLKILGIYDSTAKTLAAQRIVWKD